MDATGAEGRGPFTGTCFAESFIIGWGNNCRKRASALMEERVRQRRISQLGGGAGTDDGETLWIEQTQLHQNTRLVPEDVFISDHVVFESNDHDEHGFHPATSGFNPRQDMVHLDGVGE